MNNPDLHALSVFAMTLAMQAGDRMRNARASHAVTSHYKNGTELVTQTDVEIDQFLCEQIRSNFPDHDIISEETYPDFASSAIGETPCWIIDPIDGTVNYAHGHVHSAVSIAYANAGTTRMGIVHCPFLQETFHAIRGEFSHLNHQPIRVSHTNTLRHALVATGFPYHKDNVTELTDRLNRILTHCQDVRRLGSAAIDICWVAAGRLDAYYETVKPWDFAAARLIAQEAGARCGHFGPLPDGRNPEFVGENMLISTPGLYEPLRGLLSPTVTQR